MVKVDHDFKEEDRTCQPHNVTDEGSRACSVCHCSDHWPSPERSRRPRPPRPRDGARCHAADLPARTGPWGGLHPQVWQHAQRRQDHADDRLVDPEQFGASDRFITHALATLTVPTDGSTRSV
ncbi:hypothetical protein NKG05_04260 [Oerskovia sp. M15]